MKGNIRKRERTVSGREKKAGLAPGTPVFLGRRKQEKVKIEIISYSPDRVEENRDASPADCLLPREAGVVIWINIYGIHDVELIKSLADNFRLHPLTTEDIVNTNQRPKAEDYEGYIFFALRMLTYDAGRNAIESESVSLVLGDGYLISFQEREGDVLDPLRERIRAGKGRVRSAGSDYLAYRIMDAVVDEYFVAVEKLGDHIERLDELILAAPDSDHMRELHRLKREILSLRKAVWPLREEVAAIEKSDSALIGGSTRIYLRDLYDHTIQIIDMIETYRDIIGGMHDTFLSSLSNRMNEVMKVLTIIATIFIPLTFIAGVYGMNFVHMPELAWPAGYFLVLGLMAVIAGSMLVFFRKRGWL
jgi:magnesium transporter